MEMDLLMLLLRTSTFINVYFPLWPGFSPLFLALLLLCQTPRHHRQSRHPSIPCLVFIITPSVSVFTLRWPRCLTASLPRLLSVHLCTCSAFPSFLNANVLLLLFHFSPSACSLSGELYDLDAASLQLKVINYVSGWDHSYRNTEKWSPSLLLLSIPQAFYHFISLLLPT